ncbi:MAG: TVP38/TMEM64 family protein [Deltaproteobacteria bacterium]|nr:TVP38/TMEM64 family protein [Deltaproteobacteria bacterium]
MAKSAAPPGPAAGKPSFLRPLMFILLLGAVIVLVHSFELNQYLEKERLRRLVAAYGLWGPVIFLVIWTVAPPLFMPGLPLTLAGGILFGPFWGVVYTTFGATAGASLAFLVARYFARQWVAAKLTGTRLERLDEKVAFHGWKIVVFTRLIPFFPYVLLNYAFGITRVSFPGFLLATLFGMIPVTTAFVYFSANLLDLFQGEISRELLLGLLLVVVVCLAPLLYKRIKRRKAEGDNF